MELGTIKRESQLPSPRPIITLMTDFGDDSYVAQMKGVLHSFCPDAHVVDLTHRVPAQDIVAGSAILEEAAVRFPSHTIHIAVVDPGVGTERRLIYAEIGPWRFLAPDNGLLSRMALRFKTGRIVSLDRSDFWLSPVSPTFHGRDILCPVAAFLALGGDCEHLGARIDRLIMLDSTVAVRNGHTIMGSICRIDSFGNLITNVPASMLGSPDVKFLRIVVLGRGTLRIPMAKTYGAYAVGRMVALCGSSGWLEIAIVEGDASRVLESRIGDGVMVLLPS